MPRLIVNQAEAVPAANLTRYRGPKLGYSNVPPAVSLYIETARDSNEWELAPKVLDWSSIEMRLDGADSKATIVVGGLDASKLEAGGTLGTEHLTHLLDQLHPDKRVRIAMSRGMDPPVILFQGYPKSRTAHWSDKGQGIDVSCIYEALERMRSNAFTQCIGRRRRLNPARTQTDDLTTDLVTVETQAAHFNPNNKPNRLPNSIAFQGDEFYVFDEDNGPAAKFWSYADALRYAMILHANYSSVGVSVADFLDDTRALVGLLPAPDSADPFLRNMQAAVADVSIASMNADELLAALAHAADLHYHYEIRTAAPGDPSWVTPEYHLRVFAALEKEDAEAATPDSDRAMGSPRVHDITRDKPFADYTNLTSTDSALRNEGRKAQLSMDTRAVTSPIFLGGAWEYQVTVLLRPGWKPTANNRVDWSEAPTETQINAALAYWEDAFGFDDSVNEVDRDADGNFLRWHSVYHPKHPNFSAVADVLRLWIFPDDYYFLNEDLASSPYKREFGPWKFWQFYSPTLGFDGPPSPVWVDGGLGGSIEDAHNWVPRARPFGDTIGRINLSTTSRKPVIWMNYSLPANFDPQTALAQPGWVQYQGSVEIDEKRAALWLGESNLWASEALREDPLVPESNMIEAYLRGQFAVAITATVVGDKRLRREPNPAGSTLTRKRTAIVDLGFERFKFRNRIERNGFRLYEPDPEPEYNSTYNAVEEFNRFADDTAKVLASDVVAGTVTVPYIKTDVRLGDSFSGCSGMGIAFERFPEVVCIEYVKDPAAGYQTVYHLTDLRHAPDVGSE